jgi:hypothetical protein
LSHRGCGPDALLPFGFDGDSLALIPIEEVQLAPLTARFRRQLWATRLLSGARKAH